MLITIEEKDNKLNVQLSKDVTWTAALRMLVSTIRNLALTTIDHIVTTQTGQVKKLTKKQALSIRDEVKADVADMMNFAFSNILNEICPKDPDLQISEIAIATIENEIIDYAAEHKITLKQALQEYEKKLESHPSRKALVTHAETGKMS